MSLFKNIVSQVANQVIDNVTNSKNRPNQSQQNQTNTTQSPLNGLLGNLLGSQTNNPNDLISSALNGLMGSQPQQGFNKKILIAILIPIILNWIQKNGGLSQSLSKLTQMGLGDQVNSWVGQGNNQNLDSQDVQKIFGTNEIEQVAQKAGCSQSEVSQGIADLLPQIINQFTPNGNLANHQAMDSEIGEILSKLPALANLLK